MLLSSYRRAGQPLVVAIGATLNQEGGLDVGILLVGEHLPKADVTLRNPESGESLRVRLPTTYLTQAEARAGRNVTLEVLE